MEQALKKEKHIQAKPIMKWAGGKTQMLSDIMPKIPKKYGKYIEPFIGGGALFFALNPDKAIIADRNPELINMYQQVADNVETVISYLKKYKNTKEDFYEVRSLDWLKLKKEEAAARMIYLNKTCFNGLYRVNKICVIDKFIYDEESGEILQKKFDGIHATKIRINLIERLLLRSVAMIMCSDKYNYVSAVNLTGFLNYYDSAYGNYRELNVAKLQISKDVFSQINLERVNVSELFKRVLNEQFHISLGLYEKEPFELSEIK